MGQITLTPIAGMNTEDEDAALTVGGNAPHLFVRDAVNVDLSPAGRVSMRDPLQKVSGLALDNLWHSPLHGETFATHGDKWVRLDTRNWSVQELATIGTGTVYHEVLNNLVCVSGPAGVFVFDGNAARLLTIDTPPAPMVAASPGSLPAGTYGVAVAWLRADQESATSEITHCEVGENGGLNITLPLCFDTTITHARLYLTRQNGGELTRGEDYPIGTSLVVLPLLPATGSPAKFRHMEPMPGGNYLRYWRGRLLTASKNVLRFSEPMAYHLHDPRHGFVQFPQRITFVAPVESGVWVGQVDHVAFLAGASPGDMTMQRKKSRPPVPGSAALVDSEQMGDIAQGGQVTAVWLADNGYVIGSSAGTLIEPHANKLAGISATQGSSVVFGGRLLTAVR